MYSVVCDTQGWKSAEREKKADESWKEKANSDYFSFDRKEGKKKEK